MRFHALLLLAACLGGNSAAHAQIPGSPPGASPATRTRPDTLRTPADSARAKARADSIAARDSSTKANFQQADSVMQRLLDLPGFNKTRYQSDSLSFDARTRAMQLTNKAIVQRDTQVLVKSDTIRYNGSGSAIQVGSDSTKRGNIFVTAGQAPVFSKGAATYDLDTKRARLSGLKTTLPQNGAVLTITAEQAVMVLPKDTVKNANDRAYYGRNGTVTACEDSIPDYHFSANELKRTGSFVVARPAVLYIGDVPVMWLPFLFQDIRNGRRSGLLAPNIGVSDIVRNSPSYRRNVEGLGYYFAINDFMDAQASLDWRSSDGESVVGDPGFMKYNGEFRYHWLERYVNGNIAASQTFQGNSKNTAVNWVHQEAFTRNSSLSVNLNYVSNTLIQQQTTVNPYALLATISSSANYQQKIGPAQISIGATQKQSPGRTERDETFPTFSLTTAPVSAGEWLTWTPAISYSVSQQLHIDQANALGVLLRPGVTTVGIDTVFGDTLKANSRTTTFSFDTPIQLFGQTIGNNFTINSLNNGFAASEAVTDVETGVVTTRIYSQTYKTDLNWTPSFALPPFIRNQYNLTPSVSWNNVDPSGSYCVRDERTGNRSSILGPGFVCQSKRLNYSLSAAPTLYGIFDGFGPFLKFRHSISPTISYTYAPAADVSDEYLAAVAKTRYSRFADQPGYTGGLAEQQITFGLSTNIEAKIRSLKDTSAEASDKIKLLSMNFSPFAYDFEQASARKSRIAGLTTQDFNYSVQSDLLPGVNVSGSYSLFAGVVGSDTARFSPYPTGLNASFSVSNDANPFTVLARLFSRSSATNTLPSGVTNPAQTDPYAQQVAAQPVAGRARNTAYVAPPVKGWTAQFTFTSSHQRPLEGSNVVQFDPTLACAFLKAVPANYQQCVENSQLHPVITAPPNTGLGSVAYALPGTSSLGSNVNFNLTDHWAAAWQTQFDFVQHSFASQVVSLTRDLHDWTAVFAFTQAPGGAFSFQFHIALKAEQELKFDYNKTTYRNDGIGP